MIYNSIDETDPNVPVLLTVNVPPDISSCDNCLFLALSASSFISRAIPLIDFHQRV